MKYEYYKDNPLLVQLQFQINNDFGIWVELDELDLLTSKLQPYWWLLTGLLENAGTQRPTTKKEI